jgi:hypothetical protein
MFSSAVVFYDKQLMAARFCRASHSQWIFAECILPKGFNRATVYYAHCLSLLTPRLDKGAVLEGCRTGL